MSNFKLLFILFALLLCTFKSNAQNLVAEEQPNKIKQIKEIIPIGYALLVIESNLDLEFESSFEILNKPLNNGNLYKLFFKRIGVITIKDHMTGSQTNINFGQQLIANTYPTLKAGEIRYFKIKQENRLLIFDQTNELKDSLSEQQMNHDKEALITINCDPNDLALDFKSNEIITETQYDGKRYKLFVKPLNQLITINHKTSDAYCEIKLSDLYAKEKRYYFVNLPDYLRKISIPSSYNPNIALGSFLIDSKPPGALIQMKGQPDFNLANHKTPYTLINYKTGTEIITLLLDRYEPVNDTIIIGDNKRVNMLKKELIPKFAYLKCILEPSIPIPKVLMDGKNQFLIGNAKPLECSKGAHIVEFSADHYYTETRHINLDAGKTAEISVRLKPIMGTLSINSENRLSNIEVLIDSIYVGTLPINNLPMQEGSHNVIFNKLGNITEKSIYSFEIFENRLTILEDIKMIDSKNVTILTEPKNASNVSIDNKIQNINDPDLKLSIGNHTIRILMDHYISYENNFIVNNENNSFFFKLEPQPYLVSITTKPTSSSIFLDGIFIGKSPIRKQITYGTHKLHIEKDDFLNLKKNLYVNESSTFNINLYPSSYNILGVEYGLDQVGLNLGTINKGFLFLVGVKTNLHTQYNTDAVDFKNVSVSDLNIYDKEIGREYVSSSNAFSFNTRLGITISKPTFFLLTAGCSFIQTNQFQKVYMAKHDYMGENYGQIMLKGALFTEPDYYQKTYFVFTTGLMLPILKSFYCNIEYYSNSDIGPGVSLGLGLMLVKH